MLQNVVLGSAPSAFKQGGIFIVPHLLWHEASVFVVSSRRLPHVVALYENKGVLKTYYSNTDPNKICKIYWRSNWQATLFCLFVYGFTSQIKKLSLIWRRHHCRWRTKYFDLYSALMAIRQWGFFNVSHVLWHGKSVYNGHLQGLATLTPVAGHLAAELSLPVLTS